VRCTFGAIASTLPSLQSRTHFTMYYEDQSRRFNLLSGFLFGVLMGAGVSLLRGPVGRIELPKRRRSRRKEWKKKWDEVSGQGRKSARRWSGR